MRNIPFWKQCHDLEFMGTYLYSGNKYYAICLAHFTRKKIILFYMDRQFTINIHLERISWDRNRKYHTIVNGNARRCVVAFMRTTACTFN